MKIGIVAATTFEIRPALDFINQLPASSGKQLVPLITGVGSMAATHFITSALCRSPFDFMLQAGIGGSFSEQLPLAEVVLVQEEMLGDLGVEEEGFRDVFDMGFANPDGFPFTRKKLINPHLADWNHLHLRSAKAITVNEVTSRPPRLEVLRRKYNPDIETMEGAAFHYVCLQQQVPFLQIRSVSNFAGERDKSKWNIPGSLSSLNRHLIQIIQQLMQS